MIGMTLYLLAAGPDTSASTQKDLISREQEGLEKRNSLALQGSISFKVKRR